MTPRAEAVRRAVAAHRQAEDDWLDGEALLEEHRRRADAAAAHASDRLRSADAVRRDGRADPYALGLCDAASLHLDRAREAAERVGDAERLCAALRARADAARAAVEALLGTAIGRDVERDRETTAPARRLRCG